MLNAREPAKVSEISELSPSTRKEIRMLNRWVRTTTSTVERGGHRVGQTIKTLLRPVRTTAALTKRRRPRRCAAALGTGGRERTPATADSRAGSGGPAATAPVSGGPPPPGAARPRQRRVARRPSFVQPDTLLRWHRD